MQAARNLPVRRLVLVTDLNKKSGHGNIPFFISSFLLTIFLHNTEG